METTHNVVRYGKMDPLFVQAGGHAAGTHHGMHILVPLTVMIDGDRGPLPLGGHAIINGPGKVGSKTHEQVPSLRRLEAMYRLIWT